MNTLVALTLTVLLITLAPKNDAIDPFRQDMIYIPKGDFTRGKPGRSKLFTLEAFFIDTKEVTQADFKQVMGENPSYFKGEHRPVEKITWFTAKNFCKKIGKRLPTEWEWEKAAKAGTNTDYYWGNQMDDRFAWHKGNSNQQTHPVGKTIPNAYGLYDMSGNVWEWTSSDHEASGKVLRGGSWRNEVISQKSAHRISSLPNYRYHYTGFRCAASPSSKP